MCDDIVMLFESDNATPVHPAALRAIATAAAGTGTYDDDEWSGALDTAFSQIFGREVAVLWAASGTAANGVALATLCPPHGAIVCHADAHILLDEAGAPGFFTGGATLLALSAPGGKLSTQTLQAMLTARPAGQHMAPPRCLSLTNASEYGLCYTPAELTALGAIAHPYGMALHVDGARFASAVAHCGCAPADLTWRAGVDALSFGFGKNGAMMAEAVVLFDVSQAEEARHRRKRAGHLPARGRLFAAQLLALLENDLWLANARAANASARVIAEGAGDRLAFAVEANLAFVRLSDAEALGLHAQGFAFSRRGHDTGGQPLHRFVAGWHHTPAEVDALAAALRALG